MGSSGAIVELVEPVDVVVGSGASSSLQPMSVSATRRMRSRRPRAPAAHLSARWNCGAGGGSSFGSRSVIEREGVVAVGGRVRRGVGAELHEDPAGIEGVDAHAEAMVDLDHVMAVVEPALLAALDVVEVAGVERDVVHPRLEPEAGGDGRVEGGHPVVVELPERDELG